MRTKIRPPRKIITSDVDFDKSWGILSTAISEIYRKNESELSFEVLHRNAYLLVLRKFGAKLYVAVANQIGEYLADITIRDLGPLVSRAKVEPRTAGPRLIRAVRDLWDDHRVCMNMVSDILMYMDRVYSKEAHTALIYDAGMALFLKYVINNPDADVGNTLLDIIFDQIEQERAGTVIDRSLVKSMIGMFDSLSTPSNDSVSSGESVYVSWFEPQFLDKSQEYYSTLGNRLVQELDATSYLRQVEACLAAESERSRAYLSQDTEPRLLRIVDQCMIDNQYVTVMAKEGSGANYMIDNDKFDSLSLLYSLVILVEGGSHCLQQFVAGRLLAIGREINERLEEARKAQAAATLPNKQQQQNKNSNGTSSTDGTSTPQLQEKKVTTSAIAIGWVKQCLELKLKFDSLLHNSFQNDSEFQTTITKYFAQVVNENEKAPEYVSLLIDDCLKKGTKNKTEDEIDKTLDQAVIMFRFIADKDVFENYYKTHLAKRLLNNRGASVDDDAEMSMIGRIRNEAGHAFTAKLEGMFKDVKLSADTMMDYKKYVKASDPDRTTEISELVLTSTFWPSAISTNKAKCIFPPSIDRLRESFEAFYLSRHNGRLLTCNPSLGTADIRVSFKKRRHELNVSTYAMVILLLFNELPEGQGLSYKQIKGATMIPEADLQRQLLSLCMVPRTRILMKDPPKSRTIRESDMFYFNENFESNQVRIKVMTIAAQTRPENDTERSHTMSQVDQTRKYMTDAAIVRIMKGRKTLEHNQLIAEVTKHLSSRFRPEPNQIKKRIDSLLEQEYLERSTEDRNVYNYLA